MRTKARTASLATANITAVSSPPETLLRVLAEDRRQGVTFSDAWPRAVLAAALDREWREALNSTRDGWEGAYDRQPATRRERALAAVQDELQINDADARGLCVHCGDPIPATRGLKAIYCDETCRRERNYAIEVDRRATAAA